MVPSESSAGISNRTAELSSFQFSFFGHARQTATGPVRGGPVRAGPRTHNRNIEPIDNPIHAQMYQLSIKHPMQPRPARARLLWRQR